MNSLDISVDLHCFVFSLSLHIHIPQKYTQMLIFTAVSICFSPQLFPSGLQFINFLPPFFLSFPHCLCFCLSVQSSICHLYSSFLFLYLSISILSLHFLSKELKVMGFKAQVKTEIQKAEKVIDCM